MELKRPVQNIADIGTKDRSLIWKTLLNPGIPPRDQTNMHEDHEERNDDEWMKHSIGWFRDGKVTLDYRPVHTQTLTNDISYIKPKARVY